MLLKGQMDEVDSIKPLKPCVHRKSFINIEQTLTNLSKNVKGGGVGSQYINTVNQSFQYINTVNRGPSIYTR